MHIELYQTKTKTASITLVPWLDALDPREFGVTGVPVNPEEQQKANKGTRHKVEICTEALGTGFFLAKDAGPDGKKAIGRQRYLRVVDGFIAEIWDNFETFRQAKCQMEIKDLPTLDGSEAQIKWASKIQQESLLRIMEANDRKLDFPSHEAGSLLYIKSAKWWIENRDSVITESLALIALRSATISPFLRASLPPLQSTHQATLSYAEERRIRVVGSLARTKANTPMLKRIVDITTAIALAGFRDARWWIDTHFDEAVQQFNNLRLEAFRELLVPIEGWKMMPDGSYEAPQIDCGQPLVIAKAPDGSYHLLIEDLGF